MLWVPLSKCWRTHVPSPPLNSVPAADYEEMRSKMPEHFKEKEFFAYFACVKLPGNLEWHKKVGKMGWSSPYTRRVTGGKRPSARQCCSFASQEKSFFHRHWYICRFFIATDICCRHWYSLWYIAADTVWINIATDICHDHQFSPASLLGYAFKPRLVK